MAKVLGLWIILGFCIGIALILVFQKLAGRSRVSLLEAGARGGDRGGRGLFWQAPKRVETRYHAKASAQLAAAESPSKECGALEMQISDVQNALSSLRAKVRQLPREKDSFLVLNCGSDEASSA